MANIRLSAVFDGLYGRFGGFIFRRSRKGSMVLSRMPNMKRVRWSKAQKEHRRRFKAAVVYAKAAMKDPVRKAYYEQMALERHSIPFNMAVSDYFKIMKAVEG